MATINVLCLLNFLYSVELCIYAVICFVYRIHCRHHVSNRYSVQNWWQSSFSIFVVVPISMLKTITSTKMEIDSDQMANEKEKDGENNKTEKYRYPHTQTWSSSSLTQSFRCWVFISFSHTLCIWNTECVSGAIYENFLNDKEKDPDATHTRTHTRIHFGLDCRLKSKYAIIFVICSFPPSLHVYSAYR